MPDSLRIMHCFRSPVGGIFRHVRDLVDEQIDAGHSVGVICDDNTGGAFEEKLLLELQPKLVLGLHRTSMDRSIGPRDLYVTFKLMRTISGLRPDILHAHGAKGGAYARIIGTAMRFGSDRPVRLYCPHGGSIHYDQNTLAGRVFFSLERLMERFTDRLIFVSDYERKAYAEKIGNPRCPTSLVFNGLRAEEFGSVSTTKDADDFLYVGMMRDLKGVDLLLDALPRVALKANRPVSATLVGDGPDLDRYRETVRKFPETVSVQVLDSMPVREAFALGRTMILPSRAESLPYIVLEALAANKPLIATNVGGIPEIYGEYSSSLIEPDNLDALVDTMVGVLDGSVRLPSSADLSDRLRLRFSSAAMAGCVLEAYEDTLAASPILQTETVS